MAHQICMVFTLSVARYFRKKAPVWSSVSRASRRRGLNASFKNMALARRRTPILGRSVLVAIRINHFVGQLVGMHKRITKNLMHLNERATGNPLISNWESKNFIVE